MPPSPHLDKRDLLTARRCARAFWLERNARHLGAPVPGGLAFRREQGVRVGEAARGLFPGGVLVDEPDPAEAVVRTRELLADGATVLFEAAFAAGGVLARPDVLVRQPDGSFRMLEVKASKGVRAFLHDADLAVQWWVLARAGLPVSGAELVHLAAAATAGALAHLFTRADRTGAVRALLPALDSLVAAVQRTAVARAEPEVGPGAHCRDDRGDLCPFWEHCTRDLPRPNVFDLPGLRWQRRWRLLEQGHVALADLTDADLPAQFGPLRQAHLEDRPWINQTGLRQALASWTHPLLHLDFECWAPALPAVPGTRPYQRLPFQFSVHLEPAPDAEPEHVGFLHEGGGDPRPEVAAALADVLRAGSKATLIAWHAEFERECLDELAASASAADAALLRAARKRVLDPEKLVRRCVYHPAFGGSYSIKRVAPALLGAAFDYGALAVQDGEAAMARYEVMRRETDAAARAAIAADLRAYCRQDTLAMLHLLRWLRAAAAEAGG